MLSNSNNSNWYKCFATDGAPLVSPFYKCTSSSINCQTQTIFFFISRVSCLEKFVLQNKWKHFLYLANLNGVKNVLKANQNIAQLQYLLNYYGSTAVGKYPGSSDRLYTVTTRRAPWRRIHIVGYANRFHHSAHLPRTDCACRIVSRTFCFFYFKCKLVIMQWK